MKDNPFTETPDRLSGYLSRYAAKYPNAWKRYDDLRAARGKELPDWPAWCWCPLAGAYAIISGGGNNRLQFEQLPDIGILGALAAWRMTQGIYRFDSDVFAALWDTPMAGKIPVEILYRLPEWCVYIEAPPGYTLYTLPLAGWFTYLEYDAQSGRTELRFVFDLHPRGMSVFMLHLTATTIEQCIQDVVLVSQHQALQIQAPSNLRPEDYGTAYPDGALLLQDLPSLLAPVLSSIVSIVLYLCSVSADIADLRSKRERPANPVPRKTKKGLRTFPLDGGATTWLVGYRIGASLRLAAGGGEGKERSGAEPGEAGRSSPRPHIRRAHWHTYLTGPRDRPQKPVLKWLPPTPVGAGEIVPTIREVE